ncbi:hypothetical protein BC832DRAFT_547779 [Gaertneriomyces semiglobifer]|nr:hypothetical protein BC832DRAFT_547779 [Gaertneriomyces semiglobifer]
MWPTICAFHHAAPFLVSALLLTFLFERLSTFCRSFHRTFLLNMLMEVGGVISLIDCCLTFFPDALGDILLIGSRTYYSLEKAPKLKGRCFVPLMIDHRL